MLVPLFIAVAGDVPGLSAHIASLGAVGAVAGDVARLVAIITCLVGAIAPTLWAVPCDVPGLVAIITRRLVRTLRALTRYVSRAVTSAYDKNNTSISFTTPNIVSAMLKMSLK